MRGLWVFAVACLLGSSTALFAESDYQVLKKSQPPTLTDDLDGTAVPEEPPALAPEINPAVHKRIAEINKILENPKLPWNEFEKLLDERTSLEKQLRRNAPLPSAAATETSEKN